MNRPAANPMLLAESPELAILEALRTTLELAANALIAVNGELGCDDFVLEVPDASVPGCLADAVLTNIEALRTSLERYHAWVCNADARRRVLARPDF